MKTKIEELKGNVKLNVAFRVITYLSRFRFNVITIDVQQRHSNFVSSARLGTTENIRHFTIRLQLSHDCVVRYT